MKLDIRKAQICEVQSILSLPMRAGFYPYRNPGRYSDAMIFVMSGSARYDFAGYGFDVREGDLFFLAKNSQYAIDAGEGYAVTFIDFLFAQEGAGSFDSCKFAVNPETARSLMVQAEKRWVFDSDIARLSAMASLYQLCGLLAQENASNYLPVASRRKILEAEETMRARFAESGFTTAALGRQVSLSEVHFRRLFVKLYGITPAQYLTNLRINRAKVLLLDRQLGVAEIAEKSGYGSLYYFCRAFKQKTGHTPTEYRANIAWP